MMLDPQREGCAIHPAALMIGLLVSAVIWLAIGAAL